MTTKLYIPPLRRARVSRPRLIDQLNADLDDRLILISAPAGYGKTTLVAEWSANLRFAINDLRFTKDEIRDGEPAKERSIKNRQSKILNRVAWLSLEKEESDLPRFLIYLIAALQTIEADIGEAAAALLQAPPPPPVEFILSELLNEISRVDTPFYLVLDDYHLINSQPVDQALGFLIDHMPPTMHLVILTRSDPLLPLSRLRARGQMTEIRQADLRFTAAEAAAFLNETMGLQLSGELMQMLETRTEGWIAGLQLAALSLHGREDAADFVTAFNGSHRYIIDYLTEEVLERQPEKVRHFILETSILNRFNGPLCEAVTGHNHAQETLEKLDAANLFLVPLDDERGWYRYHHLFSDVIANRLHQFFPDRIPNLHLRAAAWFQQNDLYSEAINHALAAKAHPLAADLVEEKAMDLLRTGRVSTLLKWLNQLPIEMVQKRPYLSVFSAWVYLLVGRQEQVENHLKTAEVNLPATPDSADLLGMIATIRAYAAAQNGQIEIALKHAQKADDLLPLDDATNRAVIAFVQGGISFMQRNLPGALAQMKEASELGQQAGNIHVAVQALSSCGGILLIQGNLRQAEQVFYQAVRLGSGRSGKPLPITAGAHAGLADVCLAQQDLVSARQFAQKGVDLGEKWGNADSLAGALLTLTQVELAAGQREAARNAFSKAKELAAAHLLSPGLEEQFAACEAALSKTSPQAVESDMPESLSNHEINILRHIAVGLSNREAAEEMYLSINTVKWHLKNIYEKLDVHGRVQAVARARELGLL